MDEFEYEITACDAHTDTTVFRPKNPLNRPKVSYKKAVLILFSFAIVMLAIPRMFDSAIKNIYPDYNMSWIGILIDVVIAIIWFCFIGKKTVIWFVHIYQRYAPDRIRLKCLFEPSCSEYMILAVNKYGAFKGVYKGVKRLFRCRPPGGIDYP